MTDTKARQQLNRLINMIQQTEVDTLEKQWKRLAAYVDSHEADLEENSSAAAVIRGLENYLSDRAERYLTTMNRIGKLLTGRDAVAGWAAENALLYVECGAEP